METLYSLDTTPLPLPHPQHPRSRSLCARVTGAQVTGGGAVGALRSQSCRGRVDKGSHPGLLGLKPWQLPGGWSRGPGDPPFPDYQLWDCMAVREQLRVDPVFPRIRAIKAKCLREMDGAPSRLRQPHTQETGTFTVCFRERFNLWDPYGDAALTAAPANPTGVLAAEAGTRSGRRLAPAHFIQSWPA